MYQERLKSLRVSKELSKNVNTTRLKEDILQQIPCLCEKKEIENMSYSQKKKMSVKLYSNILNVI